MKEFSNCRSYLSLLESFDELRNGLGLCVGHTSNALVVRCLRACLALCYLLRNSGGIQ
jgi:hypothetical protein